MNGKRRKDIIGVLQKKKRILMWHVESSGNRNIVMYTITIDHTIQSTTQGMVQALCAGEHEGYEGITRTFWKVLLSRREFQFLIF